MKTKLERAIERLRDIDDWEEDSSVSVTIHNEPPPKSSNAPMPVRVLKLLPPWGRVLVVLVFLGIAVASGVAAQLVLHAVGISK